MRNIVKVKEDIYWVGVNDRKSALFEGLWPLEKGMAYNSYLIIDEKTTLVDTVDAGFIEPFIDKLKFLLQGGKQIDYLVINHMEPDHSGAISRLVSEFPSIKLVGSKLAIKMLNEMYGITENTVVVKDGETLNIGKHNFTFHVTPWLHWPETIMSLETTEKILFSGDAFGTFGTLDGGIFDDEISFSNYEDEYRRYYSNIVGKYTSYTQNALAKLKDADIAVIAATHGPVWRSNIGRIVELYDKWSTYQTEKGVVIAYASMYGNTTEAVDYTARMLSENGVETVQVFNTSKTHISHIISAIWKYKGVIIASPTYNMALHPTVEALISEIKHLEIKDHKLGLISNFLWNNAAAKALKQFAEDIQWDLVADAAQVKGTIKEKDMERFQLLAQKMAASI